MDKRNNVLAFPKAGNGRTGGKVPDVTHHYTGKGRGRTVEYLPWNMFLNVLIFLGGVIRTLLFTVLIWLRPLVFAILQPVSGVCLVVFIICLILSPHNPVFKYGYGVVSFSCLCLMLVYDWLLFKLAKGNLVRGIY